MGGRCRAEALGLGAMTPEQRCSPRRARWWSGAPAGSVLVKNQVGNLTIAGPDAGDGRAMLGWVNLRNGEIDWMADDQPGPGVG